MFPSALNRIMPWAWLAMGLLAIITLAQTLEKSLEKIGLVNWVEHHGLLLAYIFGCLAGLAWLLVILGRCARGTACLYFSPSGDGSWTFLTA